MRTRLRKIDLLAAGTGAARLALGMSMLTAPDKSEQWWTGGDPMDPTASLLLRSLGYRDALLGALLLGSGATGRPTARWFLAGAGADAADLAGAVATGNGLNARQRAVALGGASFGVALGLHGAFHRTRRDLKARKAAREITA